MIWLALKALMLVVLLFLAAGIVYEQIGKWRDHKHFPQIGRSVDIGGRTVNIYCSGEGSPTVILESGHSIPGYGWVSIERQIATFTRACWYDRAGYGWSDPGPYPNRSDAIAKDLHKLLQEAGVPPPYVLVGHLFGAFTVRVYNGFYPGEAAGIVLIDPSSEDSSLQNPTMPKNVHNEALRPRVILLAKTLGSLGLWRLLSHDPGPPPKGLTSSEWATINALMRQSKSAVARIQETPLWVSAAQARDSGNLDDLPLIVLSPAIPSLGATDIQQRKFELQAKLTGLSKTGRQVAVQNDGPSIPYSISEHMIPYESPDAVVRAVRDVVTEARARRF